MGEEEALVLLLLPPLVLLFSCCFLALDFLAAKSAAASPAFSVSTRVWLRIWGGQDDR